ncbi:MAG: c-type heme family protein [Thermodesulfobacteriota bacterium]
MLRPKYIQTRFMLALGSLIFVGGLLLVLIGHQSMREQALHEARDKARLILDRNLATHAYFNHQLKPSIFSWSRPFRDPEYFDPVWMSSTYAIRKIETYFRQVSAEDYVYTEQALNPRNPENQADSLAREFLEDLRGNPALEHRSFVRSVDGTRYLEVLRRGEQLERGCMRCHSEPERAPGDLVARYGPEDGFGKSSGTVASVLAVRIPLEDAFAHADRLASGLFLAFAGLLAVALVLLRFLSTRLVFLPLQRLQNQAQRLATGEFVPGQTLPLPQGEELKGFTRVFNRMAETIQRQIQELDSQVHARTLELQEANARLLREVETRKQAELALWQEKCELEQALQEIDVLSGLLPICANCKKIRDDKGYWNQIESYIRQYSRAEFSHSICPECAAALYPAYYRGDGGEGGKQK